MSFSASKCYQELQKEFILSYRRASKKLMSELSELNSKHYITSKDPYGNLDSFVFSTIKINSNHLSEVGSKFLDLLIEYLELHDHSELDNEAREVLKSYLKKILSSIVSSTRIGLERKGASVGIKSYSFDTYNIEYNLSTKIPELITEIDIKINKYNASKRLRDKNQFSKGVSDLKIKKNMETFEFDINKVEGFFTNLDVMRKEKYYELLKIEIELIKNNYLRNVPKSFITIDRYNNSIDHRGRLTDEQSKIENLCHSATRLERSEFYRNIPLLIEREKLLTTFEDPIRKDNNEIFTTEDNISVLLDEIKKNQSYEKLFNAEYLTYFVLEYRKENNYSKRKVSFKKLIGYILKKIEQASPLATDSVYKMFYNGGWNNKIDVKTICTIQNEKRT